LCSAWRSIEVSTSPACSSAGSVEAKRIAPAFRPDVERLDAETVARHDDAAGIALVDDEGEHALEAVDAMAAPGVIGLDHDFGVAGREEIVALGLEFGAQFGIVVDAAIEHDGQPQRGVDHGLARLDREIDDAQAPVGERHAIVHLQPGASGPRGAIASIIFEMAIADGCCAVEPNFSADSTHGLDQPSVVSLLSCLLLIYLIIRCQMNGFAGMTDRATRQRRGRFRQDELKALEKALRRIVRAHDLHSKALVNRPA
jgi:hypothetical protein